MKNTLLLLSLLFNNPLSLFGCCAEESRILVKKELATEDLVWAAKEGNPKRALAALRAGANVNGNSCVNKQDISSGNIPLTEACRMRGVYYTNHLIHPFIAKKYLKTIALLLKHGALVTAVNHSGKTATSYACKKGQTDVLALLLKHGAPYEEENKQTIVHRLINRGSLWLSSPIHPIIRSLGTTVENHIADHKNYHESNPAVATLLENHKASFRIKGFFRETSV